MTIKTAKRIRTGGWILFIIYMILLFYCLFLAEGYGRMADTEEYRYNLIPFLEIRRFLEHSDILGLRAVWVNLAGNVIGFIPFGAILPVLSRKMRHLWKILLGGLVFSAAIEVVQLLLRVGCFDVDDMILNTTGAVVGYFIFFICNLIRRKIYG